MKLAVALLLLLSVHLVSAAFVCQEGWQVFQDNCYLFVKAYARYWAASGSCGQNQASLIMIKNAEVNKWIVDQINKHSIQDMWTGALREGSIWEWMPSRVPIAYFNWAPGEPIYSWYHKCIVMLPGPDHKWNDANCRHQTSFACQKPATSVQEPVSFASPYATPVQEPSSSAGPYTTPVQEPSSSAGPYNSTQGEQFEDYFYTFHKEPKNWEAAQATCAQNQAHLAVVKKQELHKWLAAQMNNHSLNEIWIGGQYVTNGSYWEWKPSGERFDDDNLQWVIAEPSDIGYGECLSLPSFVDKFQWNETPCAANLTFACQKPASENNR